MVAVPEGTGGTPICQLHTRYVLRHKTSMVFEELSHQREGFLLGFSIVTISTIVPSPPPPLLNKARAHRLVWIGN